MGVQGKKGFFTNGAKVFHFIYFFSMQVLNSFPDVVWHASWSITGDILAISGGDNKVKEKRVFRK